MLTICVATPAALVSAQEPAPPAAAGPGQAPTGQDPEQAPAQPPSNAPPPAAPGPPAPSPSSPPPQGTPDDTTPPPDEATAPPPGSSTLVSAASSASVSILDGSSQSAFRFSPSSVTVGVGETVTWINNGSAPEGHNVAGDGLGSPTLHDGQSYSHTFTSSGTFSYICSIHPFMKGTVIVQGTTSGGGGGDGSSGDSGSPAADVSGSSSESQAVTSPDAAGSATQLPSTGMPVLPLFAGGIALLLAGGLLRRRARVS
jgi:LPXTG-motif cell wall-anchored protein